MLRFACRGCGHKMKVPTEYAGKKVRCSGCKQPIRVPTPKAGGDAPASTPASKPTRSKPRRQTASAGDSNASSASKSGLAMLDRADDGLSGLDRAGRSGGGISLAELAAMEAAAPVGPVQHDGIAAPPQGQQACPSCGKFCPDQAKLCIQCGYQFGSGKQLKTKKSSAKASASSAFGGVSKSSVPDLDPAWGTVIAGVICLVLGVLAMVNDFDPGADSGKAVAQVLHFAYSIGGKWLAGGLLATLGALVTYWGFQGESDDD